MEFVLRVKVAVDCLCYGVHSTTAEVWHDLKNSHVRRSPVVAIEIAECLSPLA